MRDGYLTLKKQRDKYVCCALNGNLDEIPEEERYRTQEEANEMERAYSILFSQHSGDPAPDCPF